MSYGRLMLDIAGPQLSPQEIQLLQNPQVGGLILFARNIESPEQVAALLAEVRAVNEQLLIAVDQEGGRVQRLREGFTRLPPMQLLGDLLGNDQIDAWHLLEMSGGYWPRRCWPAVLILVLRQCWMSTGIPVALLATALSLMTRSWSPILAARLFRACIRLVWR